MSLEFGLTDELSNTQFAPLAALLATYRQKKMLKPLKQVQMTMKRYDFSPTDKLEQVLMSILAGCQTLSEVNVKLTSELSLAQVGQWPRFADQSMLSRTLDALTLMNIEQLRAAVTTIWQEHSWALQHDWRGYLWLDFDLSGLPCSPQAQMSQKGYFSAKKNITGRQLARASAIRYRETLWSGLYPGSQHTTHCLRPAVLAAESSLELAPAQRNRTVWRFDGGAGSDAHFQWLLERGYHFIAKGQSNFRAAALAKVARRWDAYDDYQLAEVPAPVDYARPVRAFVKRRLKDGKWRHSYYLSTLSLPSKGHFMAYYHRRGGAEVEQFRQDKSGLYLAVRRKRSFAGQYAYVLLTDLAHNLLADFRHRALLGSRFENYGLKRTIRQLLCIPGRLIFDGPTLRRIELLTLNQNAAELLICLKRYYSGE